MRQGPSPCLFWERWPVGGSTGIWIWKWVSCAIANRNMMILSQCILMNTIFSFADLGPFSCNCSCKLISHLHLNFLRSCFSFFFFLLLKWTGNSRFYAMLIYFPSSMSYWAIYFGLTFWRLATLLIVRNVLSWLLCHSMHNMHWKYLY